jgi:hypothetical protein
MRLAREMTRDFDVFGPGAAIAIRDDESKHKIGALARQIGSKALVSRQALRSILRQSHGFPEGNRIILWRFLLQLPVNEDAYKVLAREPLHPSVRDLSIRVPTKFHSILSRLTRLISALAYLHPPLAECDWLPSMVFPFLQTCDRDGIVAFEIVVTVLMNWCSEWLHFVPNPPITVLSRIDKIARKNGGEAPLSLAWPVLRSFFGEVSTTRAAWKVIDHILCARPVFIEYLVAAFALMKLPVLQEWDVGAMVKRAEKMYIKDVKANRTTNLANFTSLPSGHYPVMVIVQKYPMWREKQLNRIHEEAAILKQHMDLLDEIERESAAIERQRMRWARQHIALKGIEDEQYTEFRRKEKQHMCQQTNKEKNIMEQRKKRLMDRRRMNDLELLRFRQDCERIRAEMGEGLKITKEIREKWLDLKEAEGEVSREEVIADLQFVEDKRKVVVEETESYEKVEKEINEEEQELLAKSLDAEKRIDEEINELQARLDEVRIRHTGEVEARRAKL